MTNIWQFLLQTLEVSVAAAALLLLKRIFQDKLSPRWQYGVWTLLALRILLPAGMDGRYTSGQLAAVLEVVKNMTERGLDSAYSGPYTYMTPSVALPWVQSAPKSVTDWLFVGYVAGFLVLLLRYGWSYVRLRRILRNGRPVSEGFCVRLNTLCEKYGVRPCRCILLSGISSAFVCGVIRPVLVLPADQEGEAVDEKILLHELLHVKYGDVPQGVFWCLLRCLHWCNPLLWYVGGRIACDMESLCDQRVLERLSGEARRDYGMLLLNMTNEKYASAVGTTSLSNGGKNIAKRIKAIAHFKKYPKGMAMVSVCICILMAGPVFGSVSALEMPEGRARTGWLKPGWHKEYALAAARVHRCSTQAGAIDTYIKGLIYGDPVYMAAALPMEKQGTEWDQVSESNRGLRGEKLLLTDLRKISCYDVYNLVSDAKKTHHVQVVFHWIHDEENIWDEVKETRAWSYVVIPLKLNWDGRSWTAEADGSSAYYESRENTEFEDFMDTDHRVFSEVPPTCTWYGEGQSGTVRIDEQIVQRIPQGEDDTAPYHHFSVWQGHGTGAGLSADAFPDAVFIDRRRCRTVTFQSSWEHERIKAARHVGLQMCALENMEDEPELNDQLDRSVEGESCSSDGHSSWAAAVNGNWDGKIYHDEGVVYLDDPDVDNTCGYAVRIFIDGACADTIKVKRGDSL